MTLKQKRFLISTIETFVAWFLSAFLIQIEAVINAGTIPTKELIISVLIASIFSWTKLIIKILREILSSNIKDDERNS
jgi:hypothetical protein